MLIKGLRYVADWIGDRIHKPAFEPEYEEQVDHDTVMTMVDGKLVEVTGSDSEEGK